MQKLRERLCVDRQLEINRLQISRYRNLHARRVAIDGYGQVECYESVLRSTVVREPVDSRCNKQGGKWKASRVMLRLLDPRKTFRRPSNLSVLFFSTWIVLTRKAYHW